MLLKALWWVASRGAAVYGANEIDNKTGGHVKKLAGSAIDSGIDLVAGDDDDNAPDSSGNPALSGDQAPAQEEDSALDTAGDALQELKDGNPLQALSTASKIFSDSDDNEKDEGFSLMKMLGIGGATVGGGWLLKSLFSGDKDKDDNDGSSFVGSALKAAMILTIVGVALHYTLKATTGNGLTETFAKFTGGDEKNTLQISSDQQHTGSDVQQSFGGFGSALSGANSAQVSTAAPQLTPISTAPVPESISSQVAMNDSIDADKFTSNGEKPAIFNMQAVAQNASPKTGKPQVFGGAPPSMEEHLDVG